MIQQYFLHIYVCVRACVCIRIFMCLHTYMYLCLYIYVRQKVPGMGTALKATWAHRIIN